MALTEDEIVDRVKRGENRIARFAANDREASKRFRDSSLGGDYYDSDYPGIDDYLDDTQATVAVGEVNATQIDILTKVASLGIMNPDWHVVCNNPDNVEIAHEFLKEKWRTHNWTRLTQMALLKRYVCGMGILCYSWNDKDQFNFEYLHSWECFIDPNTKDFRRVQWGGYRIRMTLREAAEEFGEEYFYGGVQGRVHDVDAQVATVKVYFDKDEECYIYNDEVIRRSENRYKCVPMMFLEGDLDPGTSIFPLGDNNLATGLQMQLSQLDAQINRTALHGGAINTIGDSVDKETREALENGLPNGYVVVRDVLTPEIGRIPAEQLAPALLEARQQALIALHEALAVSDDMRGSVSQNIQFATQAAINAQHSGGRGNKERIELERFVSRMGELLILTQAEFGGPQHGPDGHVINHTDEMFILWEALSDVTEVSVIENSIAFVDPVTDAQNKLVRLNTFAQLMPVFVQFSEQIPDLVAYANDYLTAASIQNKDRYWKQNPMQGQQGQVAGGQPNMPGAPQGMQQQAPPPVSH